LDTLLNKYRIQQQQNYHIHVAPPQLFIRRTGTQHPYDIQES
jgi:hypothetical protein